MTYNDDRDRQIHENLRAIGGTMNRPPSPTHEQVEKWVGMVRRQKTAKNSRILRLTNFFRRGRGRWIPSGLAAAVVLVAALLTMTFMSKSISAEEVFAQVASTISRCPATCITVKDVNSTRHILSMRFYGSRDGNALYGEIQTEPLDKTDDFAIRINATACLHNQKGWILIRNFAINEHFSLCDLIPKNGAILVPLENSPTMLLAVRESFPIAINLTDVQAFVESLRKAVPELSVEKLSDGMIKLKGTITKPELLHLHAIRKATDVTSAAGKFLPNIVFDRNTPETTGYRKLTSFIAGIIKARRKSRIRKLISGSHVTIIYDPKTKSLRKVNLENVGKTGSISIRFDGRPFDRSLLDMNRHKTNPKVRSMSRRQLIKEIIFPRNKPTDTTKPQPTQDNK